MGLGMVAATAPSRRLGWRGEKGRGERKEEVSAGRGGGESLGGGRSVALLNGCIQEGLLGRVNRATQRVLEANGFRLVEAGAQRCCGALHAHLGDLAGARALARRNVEAFEEAGVELVAVNAAGCGAMMKEYGALLADEREFRDRGQALASRVRDVTELLEGQGLLRGADLPLAVAYDEACHLHHAQRISEGPHRLLESIPGLRMVALGNPQECCGGAGIYGITHPDLGGEIGRDKVRDVLASGAEVVATGNPGCMMQIGAGLLMEGARVGVVHPVELLDESYRRQGMYSDRKTRT
jgi:glycolate oxidase iron-sulfur subunit